MSSSNENSRMDSCPAAGHEVDAERVLAQASGALLDAPEELHVRARLGADPDLALDAARQVDAQDALDLFERVLQVGEGVLPGRAVVVAAGRLVDVLAEGGLLSFVADMDGVPGDEIVVGSDFGSVYFFEGDAEQTLPMLLKAMAA